MIRNWNLFFCAVLLEFYVCVYVCVHMHMCVHLGACVCVQEN